MATDWRITGQTPGVKLQADGSLPNTMEVRFETIPEGIPGVISVLMRNYSPEFVQSEIDSLVATMKAVNNL